MPESTFAPFSAMLIRGEPELVAALQTFIERIAPVIRQGTITDHRLEVWLPPFEVDSESQAKMLMITATLTRRNRTDDAAAWAEGKSVGDLVNYKLNGGTYMEGKRIERIERDAAGEVFFHVEGEPNAVPAWNAEMWDQGAATILSR